MKEIKIILVDDDEDDYVFFKQILDFQTFNTTLHRVSNGDELMERLRYKTENLPNIIFLDMKLPGKSGLEILELLKGDIKLSEIIVAIYSTSYVESIAQTLYDKGADFYIQKPIRFQEMQRVIESALGTISNNANKYVRTRENYLIS